MLENDEINANSAKAVLQQLFERDESPEEIVEKTGFKQLSDTAELEEIVDRVFSDNPSAVANFRNGTTRALGYLIGQAMQASNGKANPKRLHEIITARLN